LFYTHLVCDFPLVIYQNRMERKERGAFQITDKDKEVIKIEYQNDFILYDLAKKKFENSIDQVWSKKLEGKWNNYHDLLLEFRSATKNYDLDSRKIFMINDGYKTFKSFQIEIPLFEKMGKAFTYDLNQYKIFGLRTPITYLRIFFKILLKKYNHYLDT